MIVNLKMALNHETFNLNINKNNYSIKYNFYYNQRFVL